MRDRERGLGAGTRLAGNYVNHSGQMRAQPNPDSMRSGVSERAPASASATAYSKDEEFAEGGDGCYWLRATYGRTEVGRVLEESKNQGQATKASGALKGGLRDAPRRCRCSAAATRQRRDRRKLPVLICKEWLSGFSLYG